VVGLLGMTPPVVERGDSVTVVGDRSLGGYRQGKVCRIGARKLRGALFKLYDGTTGVPD